MAVELEYSVAVAVLEDLAEIVELEVGLDFATGPGFAVRRLERELELVAARLAGPVVYFAFVASSFALVDPDYCSLPEPEHGLVAA